MQAMEKETLYQEAISTENIIQVLTKAKDIYVNNNQSINVISMCKAIQIAFKELNNIILDSWMVEALIPEFNKRFFDIKIDNNIKSLYWWNLNNKQSRINAFNKLINHYESKKSQQ